MRLSLHSYEGLINTPPSSILRLNIILVLNNAKCVKREAFSPFGSTVVHMTYSVVVNRLLLVFQSSALANNFLYVYHTEIFYWT